MLPAVTGPSLTTHFHLEVGRLGTATTGLPPTARKPAKLVKHHKPSLRNHRPLVSTIRVAHVSEHANARSTPVVSRLTTTASHTLRSTDDATPIMVKPPGTSSRAICASSMGAPHPLHRETPREIPIISSPGPGEGARQAPPNQGFLRFRLER